MDVRTIGAKENHDFFPEKGLKRKNISKKDKETYKFFYCCFSFQLVNL